MIIRRATLALSFISCLAAGRAHAQPDPLWTIQFGSDKRDIGGGIGTFSGLVGALGPGGDLYTFGNTEGDLAGPNAGLVDCFLTRHDQAGNLIWARQVGTQDEEDASGVAPDGQGGVFVTGRTRDDVWDPSAWDLFLARYNADGTQAWVIQFGTPDLDSAAEAAPDGQGGVFVGGTVFGSLFGESAGATDSYVARYDHDGHLVWGTQFGTGGYEQAWGLAPDGQGGVLISGQTDGELAGPVDGKADAFVARFDADGQRLWVVQFSGSVSDAAFDVVSDGANGAYVAGNLYWPVGIYDAFVARIDGAQGLLWLRPISTPDPDLGSSLIADGHGGVIVCGMTSGNLDGPNRGLSDCFLARYDQTGSQDWVVQFGTPDRDGASVVNSSSDGFFVLGATDGKMADPDLGQTDIFIQRYGAPCAADCDGSGSLSLFDFLCFVNLFNTADPGADCDGSGLLDLSDFLCYTNLFNAGC